MPPLLVLFVGLFGLQFQLLGLHAQHAPTSAYLDGRPPVLGFPSLPQGPACPLPLPTHGPIHRFGPRETPVLDVCHPPPGSPGGIDVDRLKSMARSKKGGSGGTGTPTAKKGSDTEAAAPGPASTGKKPAPKKEARQWGEKDARLDFSVKASGGSGSGAAAEGVAVLDVTQAAASKMDVGDDFDYDEGECRIPPVCLPCPALPPCLPALPCPACPALPPTPASRNVPLLAGLPAGMYKQSSQRLPLLVRHLSDLQRTRRRRAVGRRSRPPRPARRGRPRSPACCRAWCSGSRYAGGTAPAPCLFCRPCTPPLLLILPPISAF